MRTLGSVLVTVLVTVMVTVLVTVMVGGAGLATAAPSHTRQEQAQCHRTRPAYPQIERGTRSGAVRTLQCVLNDAGFGPLTVDGFYGPQTQAAIKNLTDGFECCIKRPLLVRTWYWTVLFSASHKLRGLELGDSGIRVKTLQRALRADGETVAVDGDFGSQTKAQVKVFQRSCDIDQTGRVDGRTAFFFSQGGCG
jgi:Putative peptidoglycan binding domain